MVKPLIFIAWLATLLAMPFASPAWSQEEKSERTWRSGKFEIVGSVKSISETEIVLKTKTRDSVIALNMLSAQDRAYLEGVKIILNDAREFRKVKSVIGRHLNTPQDGIAFLVDLAKEDKTSPYAPFAAGMALATLKGDFKAAKRQFTFAKSAIQRNQKVLGEKFHTETMAATNNNIAICMIKQFQADKAVEPLTLAAGKGRPGLLARHNIDLLLAISNMPNSYLPLGKRGRKDLLASLLDDDSDLEDFNFPKRYLLSTSWEEPLSEAQLSDLLELEDRVLEMPKTEPLAVGLRHTIETLRELDAYPDLWCAECRGSGTHTCRYCVKGRVEKRVKKSAGNSPNGGGKMYKWDSEWVRCPTCSGDFHRVCPHCRHGKLRLDGR